MSSTAATYAERLRRLESRRWKRFLPNPYRWHIRRVARGDVLEVGCGIGRCLSYLEGRPGRHVGVDPNVHAVEVARGRGLDARTPDELLAEPGSPRFDTLLCSHVLEHMEVDAAEALLASWLPLVRPGGQVVVICPQERGQASDATHVTLMRPSTLRAICRSVGVSVTRVRSFPLPSWAGRWWVHNETVLVGVVAP